MLRIRLQRVGRKHDPSFRLVVTDGRNSTKSGKFLEVVGNYDARRAPVKLVTERIKYWLSVGAQATPTVHNLLVDKKIVLGKKVNPLPKRKTVADSAKVPEAVVEAAKPEVKEEVVEPVAPVA